MSMCYAAQASWKIFHAVQEPGLTPKAINELFAVLDRDSGKYSFSVSVYMLELYQDDLADLLLPPVKKDASLKVLLLVISAAPADVMGQLGVRTHLAGAARCRNNVCVG